MNDTRSTVEKLKELSEQLKNGKISQDEFNTKKQEILHPSSVSSNSANDGDKHKNKKIQWITLVSIVTFLILLYPLFCLLPAHTQIKIMKGFYSRPGKQIIYSQTESHETAIMIYSDGKNIYYYDYKGHHEITPCLASGVYVFRPRLTYGADNLTYIDVAIENEGRGKVHPLFSSSCTYQYLQNHCLLGKTNNGAAYIIKFGEQGTNIYYAENFTIDEQDDEGIMRFTTYGKFDLDSIAQKRGWDNYNVSFEEYSGFYVDASFDTKTEAINEVYQIGETSGRWKLSKNALSNEDFETVIYSSIERGICHKLLDKVIKAQDFVENIRRKAKGHYYFIRFHAKGIKKNSTGKFCIYENRFSSYDLYAYTEDARLLELDYPCWVTIYAKFDNYESGWFTPTLQMTDACLFDGHSLPNIPTSTPTQRQIQRFYDDLSQSCKRGHEEDFAHWVEHQWDICTPRFREAVCEIAQEANIFVCSQDPGDFYTTVTKYDQIENAYEVRCFSTYDDSPYAHLIWIMDSGEYGGMALDNIIYKGVSSRFGSGGPIANY